LPCFHVQKETGVLCKRNGNFYSIVNVGYEQPRTNNNFLIDDCENAYTYYLKKYSYQNEGILKKNIAIILLLNIIKTPSHVKQDSHTFAN